MAEIMNSVNYTNLNTGNQNLSPDINKKLQNNGAYGALDKEKLKGFMQDEYKLVDASNVSGEQLTEDTIKGLEGEVDKLQEKINELQEQADKNDALIAEYKRLLPDIK